MTKKEYTKQFRDLPDALSAKEAAATLRINIKTAYSLIKSGKLPSIKIGREYRVAKTELINFLRQCEKGGTNSVYVLSVPSVSKGLHACQRPKSALAAFSDLACASKPASCGLASPDLCSLTGPKEFCGPWSCAWQGGRRRLPVESQGGQRSQVHGHGPQNRVSLCSLRVNYSDSPWTYERSCGSVAVAKGKHARKGA